MTFIRRLEKPDGGWQQALLPPGVVVQSGGAELAPAT